MLFKPIVKLKHNLIYLRDIANFQMTYFWDKDQILKFCTNQNKESFPNTITAIRSTLFCKMNSNLRKKSIKSISMKLREICCVGS
jgi:hypothetical protein